MHFAHPDTDGTLTRARLVPLYKVARRLATSPRPADACFDPDDFMDLSWCRSDRPATISVFKHIRTRRYLYLDATGRAYRYLPPSPGGAARPGAYVLHATLAEAIDALELSTVAARSARPE